MVQCPITVHVRINSRIFRRFAITDTFFIKKRWRSPAIFAAIFIAFSAVCFFYPGLEQGSLLGAVLLGVGIFMPLTYIAHFHLQIHDQCKRLGLKTLRPAYTLNLENDRLRVINDIQKEQEVRLPYASLYGVWRVKDALYIYAAPARAFILPDGQYAPSPAELYDFFKARLPQGCLHGRRP